MTLEPGAYLAPHKTPFDAEFFINKGSAVLIIDKEEISAAEGIIVRCTKENERGIRNDSKEQIILLVIKHLKNQMEVPK